MRELTFTIRCANPRVINGEARLDVEHLDEPRGNVLRTIVACWPSDRPDMQREAVARALAFIMDPESER